MLNPIDCILLAFIGICLIRIAYWIVVGVRNEVRHKQNMKRIWAKLDA